MVFLHPESSPRAAVTAAALADRVVKLVAATDRDAGARAVARWRMLDTALADPKRNIMLLAGLDSTGLLFFFFQVSLNKNSIVYDTTSRQTKRDSRKQEGWERVGG